LNVICKVVLTLIVVCCTQCRTIRRSHTRSILTDFRGLHLL